MDWRGILIQSILNSKTQDPLPELRHKLPGFPQNDHSFPAGGSPLELIKDIRNMFRRLFSPGCTEEERKLQKGDIIGICRGFFDHYGVYVSDQSVIHYSSKDTDIGSDNKIIETDLASFKRGDDCLFKLKFPDIHGVPRKIVVASFARNPELLNKWDKMRFYLENYRLYGPDETVERARSRINENNYSLFGNNCEHFAIWCKTNISESHQINLLKEFLKPPLADL